eukprot:scaffold1060_cov246-Pinguiococcus_pyrenoidosus.AAC.10
MARKAAASQSPDPRPRRSASTSSEKQPEASSPLAVTVPPPPATSPPPLVGTPPGRVTMTLDRAPPPPPQRRPSSEPTRAAPAPLSSAEPARTVVSLPPVAPSVPSAPTPSPTPATSTTTTTKSSFFFSDWRMDLLSMAGGSKTSTRLSEQLGSNVSPSYDISYEGIVPNKDEEKEGDKTAFSETNPLQHRMSIQIPPPPADSGGPGTPIRQHCIDGVLIEGPPLLCALSADYDYVGQEETELSFKAGQVIYVYTREDTGWSRGLVIDSGKQGWFPEAYCSPRAMPEVKYEL